MLSTRIRRRNFEKKNSDRILWCEKLSGKHMKPLHILDPTFPRQVTPGLCALAVMTKAPHAGQVKTRLVPPLTPDEAAALNKCFLRDMSAAISNAARDGDGCGIAVYTPAGAEAAYVDILPADFSLLLQRGETFGERLYFAAEDLIRCGFASVCLIDSDSPTVPAKNFSKAIEFLRRHSDCIVLGPCDDGGYYLIGLTKPYGELFEQIDWSTERVFDQTTRRAREMGLEVNLLPSGFDVDDGPSLRRLCDELLADTATAEIAPNTREFLRKLTAQKRL
jgi:rSAM/selenodomain-associated transferase 1